MRAAPLALVILLAAPILLPGCSWAETPGPPATIARGRSVPQVSNASLDIIFEKSEYIVWNLSGNLTVNITFASKSESAENISVSASFSTYYSGVGTSDYIGSYKRTSDLERPQYVLLAPQETRTVQVNITPTSSGQTRNGFFSRAIYVVRASNNHIHSTNFTMISNLGPYSLKIVSPAPSMKEYRVLVDAPVYAQVNVTNYSDKNLEGTLRVSGSSKAISVGPKTSVEIDITITPYIVELQRVVMFYLYSDFSSTIVGYDMVDGNATNVTDSYLMIISQRLLKINIGDSNGPYFHYPFLLNSVSALNLSVPGHVNISIMSGANYTVKDLHFTVEITGWLSSMISHHGEFTVAHMDPWSQLNVSYNITSRVAGLFSMKVSTVLEGRRFTGWTNGLSINSQAGLYIFPSEEHSDRYQLGETVTLNGSITNNYPYPLHDVKLTILLENDLRGFLSRDDFMGFSPSKMEFKVLEANRTAEYALEMTMNSAGTWRLAVVAIWGGNVSYGGDDVLQEFHVYDYRFDYSPVGIALVIAAVCAAPKAADLVIRRSRKIR